MFDVESLIPLDRLGSKSCLVRELFPAFVDEADDEVDVGVVVV